MDTQLSDTEREAMEAAYEKQGYTHWAALTPQKEVFEDGYLSGYTARRNDDRLSEADTLLNKFAEKYDGVDNGMCSICRHSFRRYDLKGNPQPCENAECLSNALADYRNKYPKEQSND